MGLRTSLCSSVLALAALGAALVGANAQQPSANQVQLAREAQLTATRLGLRLAAQRASRLVEELGATSDR